MKPDSYLESLVCKWLLLQQLPIMKRDKEEKERCSLNFPAPAKVNLYNVKRANTWD